VSQTLAPRYPKEEFAQRGDEIYERVVLPRVRPEDKGKFVVIDIETSAFEIDRDEIAASDRLLTRLPDAQVWLRRVGFDDARRFGAPVAAKSSSTEDDIRSLLAQGQIRDAQILLDAAGDAIPQDSKIRKALAPPRVTRVPRTGPDRNAEIQWLKTNSAQYRKKWVALLGAGLVAAADTLNELLVKVEALQLSTAPLVHHVD